MKAKEFVLRALPVTLFLWCCAWAPPARASASKTNSKPPKEKHWSGSLVDVPCMAKALSATTPAPNAGTAPRPYAPNYMAPDEAPSQVGQGPAMGQAPGTPATGPHPGPGGPGQYPEPGTAGQQDTAQTARENRVDDAAQQCAATPATRAFGLAMSDGQVAQFDPNGNSEAMQAVKHTALEPGKKVKAKVAGVAGNDTTIRVVSLDVKPNGKVPKTGK